MKGYGIRKDGTLGFFNKEKPQPGPYEAIIKPLAVGVHSTGLYYGLSQRTEGEDFIIGHEAAGVVDTVGAEVKDFKPGDRVLVPTITPNWRTVQMQDIGIAQHSGALMDGWVLSILEDGALAEYFSVRDADMNLALLPDEVSLEQAVIIADKGSTGFHAVELAEVEFGDSVVVLGLGAVGQIAVAAARLRGAARIIGIGNGSKVVNATAQAYGATDLLNYKKDDVVQEVLRLTADQGADKVVIAGGDANSVGHAFNMVKIGGAIGSTNHYIAEHIAIPNTAFNEGLSHKRFNAGLTAGGRVRMERLLKLVQYKRFDPAKIVTHTYRGFAELEKAISDVNAKPEGMLRAVILFDD